MRQDIQFLRGYAVSTVILAHAGLGPHAGYLGVDIFFVISGFLITRMIQSAILDRRFSLTDFFFRRAKRLLPAAYATFALTLVGAGVLLTSSEMIDYRKQLIGALTFAANASLWWQTDYFESAAKTKPLLHIWSLSLEEQYYLVLALLLLITRTRYWIHTIALLAAVSALFCFATMRTDPSAAFYLLPSRAWELCCGSLVALARLDAKGDRPAWRALFWPSMGAIILVPLLPFNLAHPGLPAAIVCAASAVIIINRRSFFETVAPLRAVSRVGDASYSLYLTHWPVLAFANNAYLGDLGLSARVMLVIGGALLGLTVYFAIERPFHRMHLMPSRRNVFLAASTCTALALAGAGLIALRPQPQYDFARVRAPNYGFGKICDQGGSFKSLAGCKTSAQPKVLVWGDSFAMHLIPGILVTTDAGIEQATRSSCPPVLGYAQFSPATKYTEDWARRCVKFNKDVYRHIVSSKEIETVVLASTFSAFTMGPPYRAIVFGRGAENATREISLSLSLRALSNTISALQAAGKAVVIVAPPPGSRIDQGACIQRRLERRISFGKADCVITAQDDELQNGKQRMLLAALARRTEVRLLDLRGALCSPTECPTIIDGIALYRDAIHFSREGSTYVGQKTGLGRLIVGEADARKEGLPHSTGSVR